MVALIRLLNAFFAALFLVGALVSLAFLVAARDGLGREPEAVWLSSGWAALMLALCCLCFVNLRRAGAQRQAPLLLANLIALLLTAAGLFAPDPIVRWIGGVSLVPFAATALRMLAARRRPGDGPRS